MAGLINGQCSGCNEGMEIDPQLEKNYCDLCEQDLEDYFWGHFAKNNEDEAGLEIWISNLEDKEKKDLIKHILNLK